MENILLNTSESRTIHRSNNILRNYSNRKYSIGCSPLNPSYKNIPANHSNANRKQKITKDYRLSLRINVLLKQAFAAEMKRNILKKSKENSIKSKIKSVLNKMFEELCNEKQPLSQKYFNNHENNLV